MSKEFQRQLGGVAVFSSKLLCTSCSRLQPPSAYQVQHSTPLEVESQHVLMRGPFQCASSFMPLSRAAKGTCSHHGTYLSIPSDTFRPSLSSKALAIGQNFVGVPIGTRFSKWTCPSLTLCFPSWLLACSVQCSSISLCMPMAWIILRLFSKEFGYRMLSATFRVSRSVLVLESWKTQDRHGLQNPAFLHFAVLALRSRARHSQNWCQP